MTEEDDFDASPDLQEFIMLSIGMGLDNLQKQGSLIPLLVSVQNDEYALGALAVDPDKLMDAAAKHVGALPADTSRYALVFNGKIGVGDDVLPAVIAQAGERGGLHGYTVFQASTLEPSLLLASPSMAVMPISRFADKHNKPVTAPSNLIHPLSTVFCFCFQLFRYVRLAPGGAAGLR